MKAAVLVGFGGIDQLEVREVPEPKTGPGEVKVRVVATSINPIEWKLREGAKRPGMTRVRVGTRVTGLVMGGYGARVVAKEDAWVAVPESMNLVDAAALPLVVLTG